MSGPRVMPPLECEKDMGGRFTFSDARDSHGHDRATTCTGMSYRSATRPAVAGRDARPGTSDPPLWTPQLWRGPVCVFTRHGPGKVAPVHGSLREGRQTDEGGASTSCPLPRGRVRGRHRGTLLRLVLRRARCRCDPRREHLPLGLESLAPAPGQIRAPSKATPLSSLARRPGTLARDRRIPPSDSPGGERTALLARHPRARALHRRPHRRRSRFGQDLGLYVPVRPVRQY